MGAPPCFETLRRAERGLSEEVGQPPHNEERRSGGATYGCSSTKLDALYTLSCTTMNRSFFVLCSATSE
jgi:hypothetical protein